MMDLNQKPNIISRNSIDLTENDFQYISNFAKINFGLSLEDSKKSLVNSRVSRRLRDMGIRNFSEYREILEKKNSEVEKTNLLSVLTTNITSFFRERHHFEFLVEEALPTILRCKSGQKTKIWSAGCSTGQEPYSIALEIARKMPTKTLNEIDIFATDIDPQVVRVAEKGVYNLQDMSEQDQKTYGGFLKTNKSSNKIEIGEKVRGLIDFSILNLNKKFSFDEKFDIIFCRNVTIYFDRATQQSVWKKFAGSLKPNGYLFVGHSERVSGDANLVMTPIATTTYQMSSGSVDFGTVRPKARL
jgi:chemotaxis protein methyltransferase CheR